MLFHEFEALRYCSFEIFEGMGVKQAIFTRKGGVSPEPWSSLNLGGNSGDVRENVIENRRRLFKAVKCQVESLYDVWQVHSCDIIITDRPRPLDTPHLKADSIITSKPGITLFMRFADCVPVFVFDPKKNVIALIHAGWQGTVKQIVSRTIEKMQDVFGSEPGELIGAIGPSIGPDHYEIGSDVIEAVKNSLGTQAKDVLRIDKSRTTLDLWKMNQLFLEMAGVRSIQIARICTACDTANWYSHRKENGKTGRFGAIFSLS